MSLLCPVKYGAQHDMYRTPMHNGPFDGSRWPSNGRGYGDQSPTNSDILGSTVDLGAGFKLGMRLDFSTEEPHLNLDILNARGRQDRHSKRILGEAHSTPLFPIAQFEPKELMCVDDKKIAAFVREQYRGYKLA